VRVPNLFLIVVCVLFTSSAFAQQSGKDVHVDDGAVMTVTKVVNGHEVQGRLSDGTRVSVRIVGLDCPDGNLGRAATQRASKLLTRKKVILESTQPMFPIAQDNYGRLVAYVRLDSGDDFAEETLRDGQCTAASWNIPHPRKTIYAGLR